MCVAPCEGCAGASSGEGELMLQAVLTFLDEHDTVHFTGETSSESVGTSPSTTSSNAGDLSDNVASPEKPTLKAAARGRTSVRSDKRQREEMIALREESLALQDRLGDLKSRVLGEYGQPPQKKRMDEKDTKNMEMRKLRAEAWQALSEVQMKRREAAEEERERLRELVHQQKKSFRQLRRYLARHAEKNNWKINPDALFDESDDTSNGSGSDEEADFKELSRTIPTMMLQTGALFNDDRLNNVITTMRDLTVQNGDTDKMSIEALESRVVPFDVATTANAVWHHHLTKAHRGATDDSEKLKVSENSIRRAFRAAIDLADGVTKARGRMETRRYVENNRVVIVQSSIMDKIQVSSVDVQLFEIRHYQWTVIGPPRHAMLRQSDKPMCQVEIFGVHVPSVPDVAGMDEASMRETVKHGCVEALSVQLEFERQSVENILMQKLVQSANLDKSMFKLPAW